MAETTAGSAGTEVPARVGSGNASGNTGPPGGSGASTTHLTPHVQTALNETYVYALSRGLYAIGALAVLGALLAWTLVRDRGVAQLASSAPQLAEPARAAERAAGAQPETILA